MVQQPVEDYTVSGTTLTIDAAVASGDVIYATHTGGVLPVTEAATIDLQGASDALILDSDADTTISADTDDQIDFKAGGTDTLFVTNGKVGITSAPDLGVGLHIKTADSGASVASTADELVIEGSGDSGMSILSGTSNEGGITFGDSGDNNIGLIGYDHANNRFRFKTNDAVQWYLDSSGNWLPAATDHGIYLGVNSATAANLLDDYEEGTYTPTVGGASGGSFGLSSGSDLLQYTKVGRIVHIQGMVSITSDSSANGSIIFSLPFTAPTLTDDSDYSLGQLGLSNNGTSVTGQKYIFVQPGSNGYLYALNDDGTSNYIDQDEVDANWQLHVNVSYVVE